MGYIRHHAICVTAFNRDALEPAHAKAVELGCTVTPIIESPINGYVSFFIAPDGSKEYWEESDRGNQQRADFLHFARTAPIGQLAWVEVQYGDDEYETRIVTDSDAAYRRSQPSPFASSDREA